MIKVVFLSLSLVALTQQGHCFVGPEELLKAPVEDSSCRILSYKPSGDLASICSGTLVSSTELLTAGHCALAAALPNSATVECGYRGMNSKHLVMKTTPKGTDVYVAGIAFAESTKVKSVHVHPQYLDDRDYDSDMAILNLDHPLSAQTMRLARFTHDRATTCFVSGYGINNQNWAGALNGSEISPANLQWSADSVTLPMLVAVAPEDQKVERIDGTVTMGYLKRVYSRYAQSQKDSVLGVSGDSGGGIACKSDGPIELIGISKSLNAFEISDQKILLTTNYIFINESQLQLLRAQPAL